MPSDILDVFLPLVSCIASVPLFFCAKEEQIPSFYPRLKFRPENPMETLAIPAIWLVKV